MCGFAGILRTDGGPVESEWLDAMSARLAPRGPDGEGRFRDEVTIEGRTVRIGLVHRRLAVIDPDDGAQPMVSEGVAENDLLAVAFNGCLYNHRRLRTELEALGHQFVTDHSDTEVLLAAYREVGSKRLPEYIEGMFAYAIWDRRRGSLSFGRDRAGEKPFYFWFDRAENPTIFVFGSTVPAVLEGMRGIGPFTVHHADNGWWVPQVYMGYCELDMPWEGMHAVPPGMEASFTHDPTPHVRETAWVADVMPDTETLPPLTADRLDELLESAVNERLESDVPLGCFLSGGVDSSLISHYAQKALGGSLKTFCVRMPDLRYDESPYAQAVADHLKTEHCMLDVEANPADDLVHLIETLGLPFGDSSILPTYWVSKAARKHVTVALSGDGGDELFLGYERYLAATWIEKYRGLLKLIPWWPFGKAHPKSRWHKLARLGSAARWTGYYDLAAIFPAPLAQRILPELEIAPNDDLESVEHIIRSDFARYLPWDLLRKTDTASMAVGLEVRAPFLDEQLASAVMATPLEILMPKGERKGLLKEVARRHLPASMMNRPKMGFAIPIGEWFRTDYGGMKTLLLDTLDSADPFGSIPIDVHAARDLVEDHLNGRADHSQRVFLLLTIALWARSG